MIHNYKTLLPLVALIILTSCKAYKQDVMFNYSDEFNENHLSAAVYHAEKNYVIQTDDRLSLQVYTNNGERIIDPNNELQMGGTRNNQNSQNNRRTLDYLVLSDGTAKLPLLGYVKIDSMTINQAELLLQEKYNEFYTDSYVQLNYSNKRVIILGAGGSKIIQLQNENMSLLEILAITGGLNQGDKAQNIKILRGHLSNPQVFQVDLSTISGMKQSIVSIEPGDIIYVEPWRRQWKSVIGDITPLLGFITSILTFGLFIKTL